MNWCVESIFLRIYFQLSSIKWKAYILFKLYDTDSLFQMQEAVSNIPIPVGFPTGSDGKEFTCSTRDSGSIPGWGRSPGEAHGYPLQYSWLENPINRAAWCATVHEITRVRHDWATNTATAIISNIHLWASPTIPSWKKSPTLQSCMSPFQLYISENDDAWGPRWITKCPSKVPPWVTQNNSADPSKSTWHQAYCAKWLDLVLEVKHGART